MLLFGAPQLKRHPLGSVPGPDVRHHLILTLTMPVFIGTACLHAQASDSIYAGRDCNNRLKVLRMPLLAELGDSARFDSLLSIAADSKAHMTSVEIRYGKDGGFQGLDANGARSKAARDQLRERFSSLLQLKQLPVGPFKVQVVRLTSTRQVRVIAGSATCEPRSHTTGLQSRIEFIRNAEPETHIHRDVLVQFILEANGDVSDAWLSRPSGVARVDTLAMQLFRDERFDPAIVGAARVASVVVQPFKF